jgi:hypothetical protein
MKLNNILAEANSQDLFTAMEKHLKQIDVFATEFRSSGFSSAAGHDKEMARIGKMRAANNKHKAQAEVYYKKLRANSATRKAAEEMWNRYVNATEEKEQLAKQIKTMADGATRRLIKILSQLNTNSKGKTWVEIVPRDSNDKALVKKISKEYQEIRGMRAPAPSHEFIWDAQDEVKAWQQFFKKKFGKTLDDNPQLSSRLSDLVWRSKD